MSDVVGTSLHIRRRDEGSGPVLVLAGDLDAITAERFLGEVMNVIAAERPDRLVLDLDGVEFVDSAGLNQIVRAHRALHRLGGILVLRRPTEVVRLLLTVTQLTGHLEIE